jgi:bifunctional UDP-N-acetylglucosamine pyrophosphorylase/glucosamine-1-phosphate N-acetyltransferase
MNSTIAAIILAAGKGTRMKSKKVNKVVLHLAQKPMIVHTVELLESLDIKNIFVVVGFAKNSVIELLKKRVKFVEQKKRLGTAHATLLATKKLPKNIKNVLILNGDDSAFYSKKVISDLILKHIKEDNSFTFLTIKKDKPFGLGRVVRDRNNKIISIVEEKEATSSQKRIKEVNPACYFAKTEFLKNYLPKIQKSKLSGEYYLTDLIKLGVENKEKVDALFAGDIVWRGVNTKEELKEANNLIKEIKRQ